MKKLSVSIVAIFTLCQGVNAQQVQLSSELSSLHPSLLMSSQAAEHTAQLKTSSANVYDTLNYFFNKHYYRNSNIGSANTNFYTIKSPYQSSFGVTHCGSVFLNSTNLVVTGLTGLVMKNPGSPSPSVTVRLYLCNVNGLNLPVFPPLDSITTTISNSTNGIYRGGTFTAPITVTANFAVLFKAAPVLAGDTVRLFLNNAASPTSTNPAHTNAMRYGEGLGVLRFLGNWQTNTNTFGSGTDYEFVVAPYINFSYSAGASALTPSICVGNAATFSAAATPTNQMEHRQYNFNKFTAYWKPFSYNPPVTDSIYNWAFTGASPATSNLRIASPSFSAVGSQNGVMTAKYRHSRTNWGSSVSDASTAFISITNGSAPNLSIIGTTAFCSNSPVTFTLTAFGNSTYTWTNPYSTNPSIVVTTSAVNTVFAVKGENGGCISTKTVNVSVNPIPVVSYSVSRNTVCTNATGGPSVALTGDPLGGVYSGPNVSGTKFSPASVGSFTTVYTYTDVSTACSNSATAVIVVQNCTGINQTNGTDDLRVYPNPALNGSFWIRNLNGNKHIEIYSCIGSLVFKKETEAEEIKIDLSEQPAGTYFVKVWNSDGLQKTVKIVNQN